MHQTRHELVQRIQKLEDTLRLWMQYNSECENSVPDLALRADLRKRAAAETRIGCGITHLK